MFVKNEAVERGGGAGLPNEGTEGARKVFSNQNNETSFPQYLISDPWNEGRFGYFTIQTGQHMKAELIMHKNAHNDHFEVC